MTPKKTQKQIGFDSDHKIKQLGLTHQKTCIYNIQLVIFLQWEMSNSTVWIFQDACTSMTMGVFPKIRVPPNHEC